MFGYMKSDPDIVGWLAFTDKSNTSRTYEIVQDAERARLFPDKPVKPGDVSAAEWLEFFDRDPELDDRFPGETRDHVLEVIREARDAAEKDGRIRRAQILESVLVANEPVGKLAEKRAALEKFFNDNANILTGPVIQELKKCGKEIVVEENTIVIPAGELRAPAERIDSHNDHRIAMSMAVVLSLLGGEIQGAEAVRKSLPDFYDRLTALGLEVQKS